MKLFRTLISMDEALRTVLAYAKRTELEEIGFDDALNRVLAEDVHSPVDSPPFDRAAMDGYAIRGEDSFGASPNKAVRLRIQNKRVEIGAGEGFPIQTGMPVPKGSNAVVMLEYTKERGSDLEIFRPVTPGKNISFIGEDVKKGDMVLKEGRVLRAHDLGMLASIFKSTVRVYKRAKLGIISTGDELLDPSVAGGSGIADVNSYMLAALTKKIPSAVGRTDFVRVKLICSDKECYVEPIRVSGSGILSSMTKSNGFVLIEENKEGIEEGERVAVVAY